MNRRIWLLAHDGTATALSALDGDEGVPEYRTTAAGELVAMLRGDHGGLLAVPLDALRVVVDVPDRVQLSADTLGDLVVAAELVGYELLTVASKVGDHERANRCIELTARMGHALSAVLDQLRVVEAWEQQR